jgi:hypothetical protein
LQAHRSFSQQILVERQPIEGLRFLQNYGLHVN